MPAFSHPELCSQVVLSDSGKPPSDSVWWIWWRKGSIWSVRSQQTARFYLLLPSQPVLTSYKSHSRDRLLLIRWPVGCHIVVYCCVSRFRVNPGVPAFRGEWDSWVLPLSDTCWRCDWALRFAALLWRKLPLLVQVGDEFTFLGSSPCMSFHLPTLLVCMDADHLPLRGIQVMQ